MKRKIISTILVILLIATIFPTHVFAANSGTIGDISWKVSSSGTLTVSGSGAIPDFEAPDLAPWTQIPGINKIVIKSGITSIGANAFQGYADGEGYVYGPAGAASIEIPSTVKSIDDTAFMFTYLLEKFVVSSSSKYFSTDSKGILYNKDKSLLVWVPGSTKGTLTIPKTVTEINSVSLVYGGEQITKIKVASGNSKFVSDAQGGLYYKGLEALLLVPKGFKGEFVIPETVKEIATTAFVFCMQLERVTIPEGITEIPTLAFYACVNLKVIRLPESLKTVGENAFGECSWLINAHYKGSQADWAKIDIADGNEWLRQCDFIFEGCEHENKHTIAPASCTEPEKLQCNDCQKVFEGQPALGHTEEILPEKSATCTENGITEGAKCTVCGETLKTQTVILALGHKGEWIITKEATKTEAGTKERTCTVCGEKEVVSYNLYKTGDVNGDEKINALDATQILRYANNKSSVLTSMDESEMYGRADVTGDGKINALDATQILRYANNKSSVLTK